MSPGRSCLFFGPQGSRRTLSRVQSPPGAPPPRPRLLFGTCRWLLLEHSRSVEALPSSRGGITGDSPSALVTLPLSREDARYQPSGLQPLPGVWPTAQALCPSTQPHQARAQTAHHKASATRPTWAVHPTAMAHLHQTQPEHRTDVQLPECSPLHSEVPRGSPPLSGPSPPPASGSQGVGDTPRAPRGCPAVTPQLPVTQGKLVSFWTLPSCRSPRGSCARGRVCPLCSRTLVISVSDLSAVALRRVCLVVSFPGSGAGFQRLGATASCSSPNVQVSGESVRGQTLSKSWHRSRCCSQPRGPRGCPKSPGDKCTGHCAGDKGTRAPKVRRLPVTSNALSRPRPGAVRSPGPVLPPGVPLRAHSREAREPVFRRAWRTFRGACPKVPSDRELSEGLSCQVTQGARQGVGKGGRGGGGQRRGQRAVCVHRVRRLTWLKGRDLPGTLPGPDTGRVRADAPRTS